MSDFCWPQRERSAFEQRLCECHTPEEIRDLVRQNAQRLGFTHWDVDRAEYMSLAPGDRRVEYTPSTKFESPAAVAAKEEVEFDARGAAILAELRAVTRRNEVEEQKRFF